MYIKNAVVPIKPLFIAVHQCSTVGKYYVGYISIGLGSTPCWSWV